MDSIIVISSDDEASDEVTVPKFTATLYPTRRDSDVQSPSPTPKRRKVRDECSNDESEPSIKRRHALKHEDYTVAWICALAIEMAAARAVLDEIHDTLPKDRNDSNSYVLGGIRQHNVVIACLPIGQDGLVKAADVAANLHRTFKCIDIALMVGIGGGAPKIADLRLGDVVVGTRIMQSDLGKYVHDEFQRKAYPRPLPSKLGTLVTSLRSKLELDVSRLPTIMIDKFGKYRDFCRPNLEDRLFRETYRHSSGTSTCDKCDFSQQVPRSKRISKDPKVHYGAIASASHLMKDATKRDAIGKELQVMCFEMEAAGIVDTLPCLVIRGISDYSDSHKNDDWQKYAAATAASYARELLEEYRCRMPVASRRERDVPTGDTQASIKKRFLEQLAFDDMKVREKTIEEAQADTCRWITEHESYKAWLDVTQLPKHRGFLWIRGKPGAGKSTIMKFAFSNFKPPDGKRGISLSFFFNARGTYLQKSVVGMYRSLLYRLLQKSMGLPMNLEQLHDIGPRQTERLALVTLKDIFRTAVLSLGKRSLTCFIDALDESDEQQIIEMVQYFEDLADSSFQKGINFRVCFSSRHYPYIEIRRGERVILEDLLQHKLDLTRYVNNRLRINDPSLKETMQLKILEKAGGVFLWVKLVVDILNRENSRGGMALQRRLAEIPDDLSKLFGDILKRDQSDRSDGENLELLLCLLWILFAKQPLSPQEFDHALWSGLYQEQFIDEDLPDTPARYRNGSIERLIISSSKGLAELTRSETPTVQFMHESVRDFLLKDKGLSLLWPDLGYDSSDRDSLCQERLRSCCHAYLQHHRVQAIINEASTEGDRPNAMEEEFPFLEYVSQQALHHANAAALVVPQDTFVSQFFDLQGVKAMNLFQRYKARQYNLHTPALYVLADQGLDQLVRSRMKTETPKEVPGERFRHPFFAALVNGHKDTVAALLGLPSADFEGRDITRGLKCRKDSKEFKGRTPLSWAAQTGRCEIVKALLQNGASPNETDGEGCSPFFRAFYHDHESILRLLIDNGAELESYGTEALNFASYKGHEDFARFLIKKGAALEVPEGRLPRKPFYDPPWRHDLTAPLHIASHYGHDAIARLLIDEGGGSVDVRNIERQTPLMFAAAAGHEASVWLLVDRGADVHARDNPGRTTLMYASKAGREAVVRYLIDKGADVNARDSNGSTALIKASGIGCGDEATARLLLESGADVNLKDKFGSTALSNASKFRHGAVWWLLVTKGASNSA
ncbi:uncharacterized protein F5Z01DRAFT_653179 [Emericellopsis atlantica]|uniref:Nucleoside phosphorylase domain-containing protein n=1 Tax=Emericellopsis atlantica TaxID=2614577 RepID=A0A9P7ZNP4_9HYPO|nr:uncharacterized protein F5Z01DRAFT_653179 [Emericellopsis atlantica]KAG9255473.1 hypothetical protein F5Z01DRAFT_653179 [Emericellopsis atlantica]